MSVTVVGASGRVGRSVLPFLERGGLEVKVVSRIDVDAASTAVGMHALAERVRGTTLLNLAGLAHLRRRSTAYGDLWQSNVGLPLALLDVALLADADFVHLSSTKAIGEPKTAYAMSKQCAESLLRQRHARSEKPVRVSCVRPCAVLAPPFEAGKLGLLVHIPKAAAAITPRRRVPVIEPGLLAEVLISTISEVGSDDFHTVDMDPESLMSLHDVLKALHRLGETPQVR